MKSSAMHFYADKQTNTLNVLHTRYARSFSTETIIARIPSIWYGIFRIPWRTDSCIPRRTIDINLNSSNATSLRCFSRVRASRNAAAPISRRITLCSRVLLPIYCFPSALPRKNRVEMALNYTNPIEFATPRSNATYILKHSSNKVVACLLS